MEFSPELRSAVADGDITLTFRLWQRARVKAGGRYVVGPVTIEVDTIDLVPFSSITADDVRQAGEPDLDTLRARAAHAGPIEHDTVLFRIEFHVVG